MKYRQTSILTILTILIAILFLCSLSTVNSATINVNNSTEGGGIQNGLNNVNNSNGDVILLESGNYSGSNNTGIGINKNVTIQGNGPVGSVVIDGKGLTYLFSIYSNMNVTFINISFINGYTIAGNAGGIGSGGPGSTTIINCIFTNNTADYSGGAIYNGGNNSNMSIINCTFNNNTASQGGAIWNSAPYLTINGSSFYNNKASGTSSVQGGAIRNTGNNLTIENSTFDSNNGGPSGGAIHNSGGATGLTIIDSNFNNNSASQGGAIRNAGTGTNSNFVVRGSNFTNNKANGTGTSYGGAAIWNDGGIVKISTSNFINNTAEVNGTNSGGGSILNSGGADFKVTDSTFENNSAIGNSNSNGFGGAILNNAGANFLISNSSFTNNSASSYGGSVYNTGSNGRNFTINNSNFTDNFASNGGAVYNTAVNFTISNSNFEENNVSSSGGAVYNSANGFSLNNSNFSSNSANIGGSIYNAAGGNYFNISNSNFMNNIGRSNAGAIYNNANNLTIRNSSFINNSAKGNGSNNGGGAIYNTGSSSSNVTILDSEFINNTAVDEGGAIYNQLNNNFTIRNSSFINNNAGTNGGAIFNNGANANITNSTFNDNVATGNGGSIYNYIGGSLFVSRNMMSDNSAALGQMIYNLGTMGILNLTYINNSTESVKRVQNVTLFASLTDDMGNTITGQNINFYVNGALVGSVESIEGYANITYGVNGSAGTILPVNGTYVGIGSYPIIINNGQLLIQIFDNSTIDAPDGKVGTPINISGVATDEDGNPIANTQITVSINGVEYNVTTNSNGEWNLLFTPGYGGNFTAVVSWAGNSTNNGFTNSTTFNIAKLSTHISVVAPNGKVGQIINIHGVLLDENGEPIANAQISVTVDGKTYTVTTDESGIWTLPYKLSRAGNIEVLVSFAGNDIYLASENMTTFNVKANNETNETNNTNITNNNPAAGAAMKKTGIPIIGIFLVLLSVLGVFSRRK